MLKHGLTVARRTVTKYRKAMNIPSSRQRRDWSLGNGPPPAAEGDIESVEEVEIADESAAELKDARPPQDELAGGEVQPDA